VNGKLVIKVKEITINRGRKFAWKYGNGVGYGIGTTVEGTTAKDTLEDMRKVAIKTLNELETGEQTRCKDVMDIAELKEGMEFKEALENATTEPAVRKATPGFRNSTPAEEQQFKEEKLEITEEVLMDPNEVTVMAKTDLSMLVSKKGFQKWIPFSLMPDISKDDYNRGEYIEEITIKEDKRKWFNDVKPWEPLKLMKGGGS